MRDVDGTIKAQADPIHQLIERWWEDHFPGSALARDTAAWNVAHAAKETLKRLLAQAARPGENPPPANAEARRGGEDLQGSM